MAHFGHVIIRAVVIPTVGCSRNGDPYIFLHIIDEERETLPG